jgi:rod shape-determining protein MreC
VGQVVGVEQLVGDQQRLRVVPSVRFDRIDVVWVVLAAAPEADPRAEIVQPLPQSRGLVPIR